MRCTIFLTIFLISILARTIAAQNPNFPAVLEEVETVAGKVDVYHRAESLSWSVRINGASVLESDKSLFPYILKHIKTRISPFDELIIFHRVEGTYCNGGRFWFLGLKRDGTHKVFDGIGQCFAVEPKVTVGRNYVKVSVRGGFGNRPLDGEPYLNGGVWVFQNGRIRKTKTS